MSTKRAVKGGRLTLATLVVAAGLSISAMGQFNSSLSGTVQYATGATIPGATVTITNVSTGRSQSATASAEGVYKFNELPAAHYNIVVTAVGFQGSTINDLALVAETPRNIDVKLATGGATETVTVSADSVPVLQTVDANIQTTIDSEQTTRLPTYGADPYELIRTASPPASSTRAPVIGRATAAIHLTAPAISTRT